MERKKFNFKDEEAKKLAEHTFRSAMNNPILIPDTPTAEDIQTNVIAKVTSAVDYVYMKFPDGKLVRFTVTEVT